MSVMPTSINSGITSPMGVFNTIAATNMTVPQTAAIQGKMFTVNHTITDIEWSQAVLTPEDIKMHLTQLMLHQIYKNNCIEFTKQLDNLTGNHIFHARIFVVPDTQVRIIRLNT